MSLIARLICMPNKITEIKAFEPVDNNSGAEITFSTYTSRKSFHLPKPSSPESVKPMAIESFALDPQTYYDWMNEVESFHIRNVSKKS